MTFPLVKRPPFYCLLIIISSTKAKGKIHPRTGHKGPERYQRYNYTLSLTSALDGGGWSTPRPGRLTPGKETRYALYRRLGGPQGRSGRVRKISTPPGFDPRTVQPVASRYND
jgi:rRNA maturation protein Nop10